MKPVKIPSDRSKPARLTAIVEPSYAGEEQAGIASLRTFPLKPNLLAGLTAEEAYTNLTEPRRTIAESKET